MHAWFDALTEETISQLSREECIKFLCWNDPNGSYTDQHCDADNLPRLTDETAREAVLYFWQQEHGE
jgi:hypothetical protein